VTGADELPEPAVADRSLESELDEDSFDAEVEERTLELVVVFGVVAAVLVAAPAAMAPTRPAKATAETPAVTRRARAAG